MFICRDLATGEVRTFGQWDDCVRLQDVRGAAYVDPELRLAQEGARGHAASFRSLVPHAGGTVLVPTPDVVARGPLQGQRIWRPHFVETVDASKPSRSRLIVEAGLAALHRAHARGLLRITDFALFKGRLRFTRAAFKAALDAYQAEIGERLFLSDKAVGLALREAVSVDSAFSGVLQAGLHGGSYGNVVEVEPELVPYWIPFSVKDLRLEDKAVRGAKPPRKRLEDLKYNIYRQNHRLDRARDY